MPDAEWLLHRNGYVISEVGKPPDLVFEVGSESTGRRDYTEKREIYAEYGAREYWRFDRTGGDYHDAPLAGDRLVDGKYEPIEILTESDGHHWGYSEVMGLEFWWEDGQLRFRDPVSGEFLDLYEEVKDSRDAAETRAESEHTARIVAEAAQRTAEAQAESERAARRTAEAQVESERAARRTAEAAQRTAEALNAELEAEIRRLRGE